MATAQTTRAHSIMTLDGYVSRGKAPPNSVPRDHAMLQDFAAYLELRLKCLNMSMLRRIFADFLNEQENTLVPLMQQGCTIITIYPVLRTSAWRRRQAEFLLAKPKHHLDTRGCVFLYLQYRTATRNMALLKHLFLEFVNKRETSLMAFVERGSQVISVIPFELPQMMPPARPPASPAGQVSPRAVDTTIEQQPVASELVAKKTTKKRKRKAVSKPPAAPADDAEQQKPSEARGEGTTKRRRKTGEFVSRESATVPVSTSPAVEVPSKRGRKANSMVPLQEAAPVAALELEAMGAPVTKTKLKRGRKAKIIAVPLEHTTSATVPEAAKSTPTRGRPKTSTRPLQDATSVVSELVGSVVTECPSPAAKSTSKRVRKPRASTELVQENTATEPVNSVTTEAAKSTPKRVRKPVPLQVLVSVAATAVEPVITEASSAAKPISKRGRMTKAGTIPLQQGASELVESVVLESLLPTANSFTKRGRKPRSNTVPQHDAAPVAATKPLESALMEATSTPKRVSKRQTAMTSVQEAASVATMVPAQPVTTEAAKSTPKRGRKPKTSTASIQEGTSAPTTEVVAKSTPKRGKKSKTSRNEAGSAASTVPVESVTLDIAIATQKRGRKPKTSTTLLQDAASAATTEEVESVAVEAVSPPTMSTPKCGTKSTTNPVELEDAASEATTVPSEPVAVEAAKSTPNRGRKAKTPTTQLQDATTLVGSTVTEVIPLAAKSTPKRGKKSKTREDAVLTAAEVVQSVLNEVVFRVAGEFPSPKRRRKRKSDAEKLRASEGGEEKSRKRSKSTGDKPAKRGKPVMSEEMCRSQCELARRMEAFEAQIPWEAAYNNVSPPFDEAKHPTLALKFRNFWLKHARAVWERKFWAPMSRKLNLAKFNKRNNRQLAAKNAFETLIISAYEELGAEFFVNLDAQKPRHPGWWYRGPVVALFALQQIKGEEAIWEYVMNDALKRFPDCNLPLPLTASNSGAMRIRHKRESESMWIANHEQTAGILEEMAALIKAQGEARQRTMEADGESENAGTDSAVV